MNSSSRWFSRFAPILISLCLILIIIAYLFSCSSKNKNISFKGPGYFQLMYSEVRTLEVKSKESSSMEVEKIQKKSQFLRENYNRHALGIDEETWKQKYAGLPRKL